MRVITNICNLQLGLGLALLGKRLFVAVVEVLPERLCCLWALELQSGHVLVTSFVTHHKETYVGVKSWFSIVNGSRNSRTALTFS